MTGPVGRAYAALVAAGEVKPDPESRSDTGDEPRC